jgi:hypothetical protein
MIRCRRGRDGLQPGGFGGWVESRVTHSLTLYRPLLRGGVLDLG